LLDAGIGLEKTNFWLDSEEEILEKAPHFTREQIKVILSPVIGKLLAEAHQVLLNRDGRVSFAVMAAG
jgi:hypothetical protein